MTVELRTLVLVEDDETFARTLQRSLERRGYAVSLAHSPAELDALLERQRFDYAVVDLEARHCLGPALRRDAPRRGIPTPRSSC